MKKPLGLYSFYIRKSGYVFIFMLLLINFVFAGAIAAKAVPSGSESQAQQARRTITGIVKDQSGNPIPGVTVMVKGTNIGQVTNAEGQYSIEVPSDARTLAFSFVGMVTQEISVAGKSTINVTLADEVTGLNEVVVVGYGTQKKIDLTGSVATVNTKDFEHAPNTDALQAIQGKVAGVTITSNSGMPGDSKEITIRGVQSISGNPPMYVVDNVIMDNINSINPNDIESISILKDAASAAIYGSRASGGVILITTKRGSKNEAPTISFHTYVGVQQYSDLTPKNLNTQQWLMLDRESYLNAGLTPVKSSPYGSQNPVNMSLFAAPAGKGMNVDLPAVTITGTDANGNPDSATAMAIKGYYINTDWLKELTQPGIIQSYDLSVSGGNAKSTYYTSASYFKHQGLILNSGADRISFRFNSNHNITDFLEFGNSLNIYSTSRAVPPGNPYFGAIRRNPISRPYQTDEQGNIINYDYVRYYTWEGGDVGPLIHAKEYTNDYRGYGVVGNIFLKVKLFDGLTFTPRLSMDYNSGHSQSFTPELHITGMETQSINSLGKGMDWSFHWITDYQLNYEKTFNKVHNVSATAIYSQEEGKNEWLNASRYGTPNNDIKYLEYASSDQEQIHDGLNDYSFVSYIGRVNYNYNSKYYIAGSVRRDGTSRYRNDYLWGVFPAVSGAWRISKEKFFEPFTNKINDLKIRGSVGTLGNMQGGYYPTYALLEKMYAVMGPTNAQVAVPSLALGKATNTQLQWQSSIKKDIGLDLVMLDNKLTITADYYRNSQSKMLMSKNLPFEAGKYYLWDGWVNPSDPPINAGHVESHGYEFTATFQDKKGDFSYGISGNLAIDRNKLTDLNGLNQRESGLEVGQPVYSFFGYTANGIIKTQADLDSHPYLTNPANAWPMGLGDIWTVDVNGYDTNGKLTGKPDGKIDAADRGFIGKKYPDFTYGLSANIGWKRWTLQIIGYGVQGVDLNTMSDINGYFQYTSNEPVRMLDRWNATLNPNGNMPRVTKIDKAHNATNTSSFWLSDASFFKINNLNLRYLVPENICQKLNMKSLEVYGSVENLKTFTKYPGGEVDVTDQSMWQQPVTKVPQPRTWVLGLKVSF